MCNLTVIVQNEDTKNRFIAKETNVQKESSGSNRLQTLTKTCPF